MVDTGRPRLTTAQKTAQGTLEQSRTSQQEPKWEDGDADPPAVLSGNIYALACWRDLVPDLIQQGLFPRTAKRTMIAACQLWSVWLCSQEAIEKDGRVIDSRFGEDRTNPEVAVGMRALAEYLSITARFGIDPVSAGKVTAHPKGIGQDELAKAREQRRSAR